MNTVSIYAGPRKGQNTELVLQYYLKGLHPETEGIETYRLSALDIAPCNACMACSMDGNCIIPDDMQSIYNAMDNANVIVLATPFYFNSVSAMAKAMIDRCQKYWAEIVVLKKKGHKKKTGILIVTAGSKEKNQERIGAQLVAKLFFLAVGAEFSEFIFIDQTDVLPISERQELLEGIEAQGKAMRIKVKELLQL